MRYGLDFGTSNSSIAIFRNGQVELIPVDPLSPNPTTMRTLLFIEANGKAHIGEDAVATFVERNVGREIVRSRVVIPKIIETVFGDEYVQFDADTEIPGRFFQALKSSLKDDLYEGTNVFGTFYALEELIAAILREMKRRADEYCQDKIDSVVLGRPVLFSKDPKKNELAQTRLLEAAKLAGFKDITLLPEPLGAAFHYKIPLNRPEIAFVFDFGGGTLDFAIVKLVPGIHTTYSRDTILGVGGVVVGGDILNEDIMEFKLLKYFGKGVEWKPRPGKSLPMPSHILAKLRTWYTISQLNERDIMKFLEEARRSGSGKKQMDALICLIRKSYGWALFQEIEGAKCELSSSPEALIKLHREVISINEKLQREEFERIITPRLVEIDLAVDETIKVSGLKPEDIDIVLRTGGSSLIPCVQRMLEKKFGFGKVYPQDVFTSVVSGLAVVANTGSV